VVGAAGIAIARVDPRLTVWESVHHLIRAPSEGEAAAAAPVAQLGGQAEAARELAYSTGSALLKDSIMALTDVFHQPLGSAECSLVNELHDFRNPWAHEHTFS
jgi:hypothetical protein